ncbi:aldehyde dehydrogenase family protein [Clostridium kluyveri]|uniref:Succinate-semialdehyde dehydrogenase (acetylating) n=2 Tax=Clostridium kluyveri TaxID=1534 RepID=SUCD_CLOK5|nr:aldehyde dehydrogenase family protein [Clostridium kluyveri]P38947.2 RecName: Full=Succinate-semialdehyde dehydrogenase (acetylating) [Clostridium kluyveri DSM 555]8CEI_A Chain A, Succinate-semialdehyde dehydrogenase (acetylating) [Clostridium kluyveri]8CEI_B Chain B, Succinate-semialdehyde dehydrogenase (acetylating) [Clostridium kluyveri]8CEI_C Chain C, Succinate-semialdehyde dehydrogenase (acetylating) [Clostridium kluyveri]8CEI_D Chain D, Succinate-semialdehyde dehydrogenase (acetylatin
MSNEVSIKELIEKAKVAQKKLEAYSQEQVDVLVKALGKVVYDNAEMFAKEAVEETEMGVYEDKVAKCHLKSGAIWNHIKDKKTVGIIKEEPERALVYVAKPKGVVAATTPITNPVVTPMCNAMAAIKGRNTIIVAPHPKAKKVSAHTVELMNAELKKLGAPENIIQIVEAPSREAAKELMESADVVIATGGAGRVKAAYSSGRPAYGVGPGNSQVIVDKGYDYNKAAQDIITGRKYDNGIICSSEQSVIAPAEDYDKVIAAFVENGAFYVEDEETVEKFRSTLFKDGKINSKIIGKSVQIIADLAGVKVPEGTKVIVLKGKGAGEKDVLCKEKMCPVLVALKYDTFEEAVEIAMANYMYEGAGHTAGIHSDNDENIRYAGTVLPISRLVVNQPATTAGGSFNNGFNPTTTLGCGSWGRNSISENLTYEHLINVSRIGYFNKEAKVPSYEEIWG